MIFVTVGTHEDGFPRLVTEADRLAGELDEEVVIQSGYTRDPVVNASAEPMMPFDRVQERMRAARVIVTHGGPASIMQALAYGKVPVVVPRQARYGEHVDDHQVRFARRIADRVIVVEDVARLGETIRAWESLARTRSGAGDGPANARRFAAALDRLCETLLAEGGPKGGVLRWRR